MSKKKNFQEDLAQLRPKLCCSEKPKQNTWNKIVKSSKTREKKKSLIYTFAGFFDSYYES